MMEREEDQREKGGGDAGVSKEREAHVELREKLRIVKTVLEQVGEEVLAQGVGGRVGHQAWGGAALSHSLHNSMCPHAPAPACSCIHSQLCPHFQAGAFSSVSRKMQLKPLC